MLSLGLSSSELDAFEQGLVKPHSIRIGVELLDLDQRLVSVLPSGILSGQVDVDAMADVTRTASLEFLDPDNILNLDTGSAATAGLYLDRMIRINYGVWSHDYPEWVTVPIFTGPIDTVSRDEDVLTITAQGKESLLQTPASFNWTYPKGSYKTGIITSLLATMGETFVDVPHYNTKTTNPLTVASATNVWEFLSSLASSWGNAWLVYDGRGYARLSLLDRGTRWTFRGGEGGSLATHPRIAYDLKRVRNFIVVQGALPAGGKQPVQALAHAPASHPFSSTTLGRGGKKRYLREDIQDDTITTKAAAQARADLRLQQALRAGVSLDFESLVIPHIEPWDVVVVETPGWSFPMTMTQYTIPLSGDGKMVVGRAYEVSSARRARAVARKGPRRG